MKRARTLDIDMVKVLRYPERIMRNPANPCFLTTFNPQGQKVQEPINSMDDVIGSNVEEPPSISKQTKTPALESLLQSLNNPKRYAQIREIAQEEARCIYAFEMDKPLLKAAKYTTVNAFQTVFESVNDRLKNKSIHLWKVCWPT